MLRSGKRRSALLLAAAVVATIAAPVIGPSAPAAVAATGTTERVSVADGGAQANAGSFTASISADGRAIAFESDASNLVATPTGGLRQVYVGSGGTTLLVSANASGIAADDPARQPAISADGRYVVFASAASNLVAGVPSGIIQIYRRDLETGAVALVSKSDSGTPGDGGSADPAISADGRFVAFSSEAGNLHPLTEAGGEVYRVDMTSGDVAIVSLTATGDPSGDSNSSPSISADGSRVAFVAESGLGFVGDENGQPDVYVWDASFGTSHVSRNVNGSAGEGVSVSPAISADGRFIAFTSTVPDMLSEGDEGAGEQIYVRDTRRNRTQRVSSDGAGAPGSDSSHFPVISADGSVVAFQTLASNLVPGDADSNEDVVVVDRRSGSTVRVSISTAGDEVTGPALRPSISADGRTVAFAASGSTLVPGDTNGTWDVFTHVAPMVFDAAGGSTVRVSESSGGVQGDAASWTADISADGRWIVFSTSADNLGSPDNAGQRDVYAKDRITGRLARMSMRDDGQAVAGNSFDPAISADGRFVVFTSDSEGLVSGDSNNKRDVFLRDRDTDGDGIFDEPGETSIEIASPGGNDHSGSGSVSVDGRIVVFSSFASNFSGATVDDNGTSDIFVYDRLASPSPGVVNVLSRSSGGTIGNGPSDQPRIARTGITPWVTWRSEASNLVAGDTNGVADIFLLQALTFAPLRVSVATDGSQANGESDAPAISGDGRFIAFSSSASNLVAGDLTGHRDIFVRDLDSDNDGFFGAPETMTTTRVSLTAGGTEALGQNYRPSISDDGRFVAFESGANFMVGGDNDAAFDVFVRDRDTDANGILDGSAATTLLASIAFDGLDRAAGSGSPAMSADGRFVAFSGADALAADDTNSVLDVYLRDVAAHPTDLMSIPFAGRGSAGESGDLFAQGDPSVSADGRWVAFTNDEGDLADRRGDVFVKDRLTGAIDAVMPRIGIESFPDSGNPRLSANGRYVTFDTLEAPVEGDEDGFRDVYRFDRVTRLMRRVSQMPGGAGLDGHSVNLDLSADGRYALFASTATSIVGEADTADWDVFIADLSTGASAPVLAGASTVELFEGPMRAAFSDDARYVALETSGSFHASDVNGAADVYLVDRVAESVTRVSAATAGDTNAASGQPAISADGSVVAFSSDASNIVAGDTNADTDVFVWIRATGSRQRISVGGAGQADGWSDGPSLSADGRFVGFRSQASNLVAGDLNPAADAFLRDRASGTTQKISRDFASRRLDNDYRSGPPALSADASVAVYASEDNRLAGGARGSGDVFATLLSLPPAIPTADVRNLTLLASTASVEAGAASIPMASIPVSRIPALSAQAGDTTLGSIPLGSIPLGSIPLGSIGLDAAAAYAPEALDAILISSIPIDWTPILEGSTLAGLNQTSITLLRVLNDPVAGPRFRTAAQSIPLEEFGVDRNLLRGTSVVSALLGAAPLGSIPVPGGAADWCAVLTGAGYSCAGFDPDATTMLGLDIAGAPLGSIPLGSIPLGSIPLGSIPLGSIPLGSIPLGSIPLGSIKVASLSNPNAVVDCSRISCAPGDGKTLADAQALSPSALRADAVIAMLQGALGNQTLGEVVVGLLLRTNFPWESVPIDGLQDIAGGPTVTYTASYEFTCTEPLSLTTRIQTPPGFLYVNGSTTFAYQFSSPPAAPTPPAGPDPVRSGATLTWSSLPLSPCDGRIGDNLKVTVRYRMYPGLDLGDFSSGITVVQNGTEFARTGVATVAVRETLEPNDTKDTATPIQFDHLIVGHIAHTGDRDLYRVALPAGRARVFFSLSHQAEGTDADLVVHTPPKDPLQSLPLGSIPLGSIPLEDDEPDFHDDRQIPPETLADVPLGSIELGPVGSISANRGNADERAEILTETGGGFATIEVIGYNGGFSNPPYVLRAWTYGSAPLPPAPPRVLPFDSDPWNGSDEATTRGSLPSTLPAGRQTLFIVNQDRLHDLYGPQAMQDVVTNLNIVAARPEVAGALVSVDGDAAFRSAFAAWDADPNSISAANGVVRSVNDIVNRYRPSQPGLKYIVLVGSDEVIAHARYQDRVTLSNEIDEASDLAFTTDGLTKSNALYGSAAQGQILSDDAYASFTTYQFLDEALPLPDISVARLLETPAEVSGQLRQYVAANGIAAPQSALVTGYDFLTDGATITADALDARFGPARTQRMINETWTRQEIIDAFVAAETLPDIAAVNAHYSHNLAQPAGARDAAGLFGTADIPAPPADPVADGPYSRALLFTVGCHSGLSVPDVLIGNPTVGQQALLKDWAQTWAGHRTAVYVANTGFGYGDTEASALSERLMNAFAARMADDSTTVGEKLVAAKHEYFRTAGVYGVYDFKALIEATMYGLPFWRLAPAAAPPAPPAPPATSPDPVTGLPTATFTQTPVLTRVDTPRGTYWEGPDGTISVHYRPTQPLMATDVTVPGLSARGATITSLSTVDVPNVDPLLARPTIDDSAHEPETRFDSQIFPAQLAGLAVSRSFGQESATLNLIAGQFRSNEPADGRGTQRNVVSATIEVAYSTSSDRTPPVIHELHAIQTGPTSVRIVGRATDDAAAGVKRFSVLYHTGGGTWSYVELARVSAPDTWQADVTVAAAAGTMEIAGQAQDAAGNVAVSTNKAALHPAVADAGLPSILIESPAAGGAYVIGSTVHARYSCSDAGGIASCVGTVANGARIDTSSFGVKTFTVTATDAAGNVARKTIAYVVTNGPPQPPVDSTPPVTQFRADDDIVINVPPALSDPIPGRANDDLSGVASVTVVYRPVIGGQALTVEAALSCNATRRSCDWLADAPTVPGMYEVFASAKDLAGNVETPKATRTIFVI